MIMISDVVLGGVLVVFIMVGLHAAVQNKTGELSFNPPPNEIHEKANGEMCYRWKDVYINTLHYTADQEICKK
jgi:hypothetical protein